MKNLNCLSFSAIFLVFFIIAGEQWMMMASGGRVGGAAVLGHEIASEGEAGMAMVKVNHGEASNSVGSCTVLGHGGGCSSKECVPFCRGKYGQTAIGLCYTISTTKDTCLCRYSPC